MKGGSLILTRWMARNQPYDARGHIGGTGYVGRFIVEELLDLDMDIIVLGRTPPEPGFFSRPVDLPDLIWQKYQL